MRERLPSNSSYQRYQIDTIPAPDLVRWPDRFLVKVNRLQLAKLLISEIVHYKGDIKAITSRPCLYGTFSGPIGGFAPRPQYCVGCLRCTTQHPETVSILPNPERQSLGDSYFHFTHVNAVAYEAESGSIPVKGAGFRGEFGGDGWDGMWTDMSEIVRPTRDGIHGREFISTVVDIGEIPSYLVFDDSGDSIGMIPRTFSIPIPMLYDTPPDSIESDVLNKILYQAAGETQTMATLPATEIKKLGLNSPRVIPLIKPGEVDLLKSMDFSPSMIELDECWDKFTNLKSTLRYLQVSFPDSILAIRVPFGRSETYLRYLNFGIRVFHLVADYHGRDSDGRFILDLIRDAHLAFVGAGIRDEVTLIGSGGIVAAEHVPKAIICGLDLVALDTALLVALQAHFEGECADRRGSRFVLPGNLTSEWGIQRLKNMTAAWHDQLLEILGAMGLREVRRLRGEIGRAMFQVDLEREAFAEIAGYG